VAIGNTDAHAKNISLLRHPDGTAILAPAYDVAMHVHHPTGARHIRRGPTAWLVMMGVWL
jgi:serine/threonine-protein kinase HipA